MASVKFNSDGADDLAKALRAASRLRTRVGILGQKDKRTDDIEGNSDIGFKMEFGTVVEDGPFKGAIVPARSFLGRPLKAKRNVILERVKEGAFELLKAGRIKEFFERMGVAAVDVILEAFDTSGWGSWAPNAAVTKMLKESDKPLIDTGQLQRSIVYKVVRKG